MTIDQLFQQAVALIGAGDVPALDRLLTEHPELASERLADPGPWLRDKISGGAKLTLAMALCLGRWDHVSRLAMTASDREKRMGFVLAALNGKPNALRRMMDLGANVNSPSEDLYSHGTPLHHAVCSGSLD